MAVEEKKRVKVEKSNERKARVAKKVIDTDKNIENEHPQEKTIDTDIPLEKNKSTRKFANIKVTMSTHSTA